VRLLLSAQTKPDTAEQIGITDFLFIPASRLILQYLELIADYAEDIAKKIIDLGIYRDKVTKDVVAEICHLGELSQSVFQKAVDCVFTGDFKVANEVIEMERLLETRSDRLMREMPEIPFLGAIISFLGKIADVGAGIADIAINRALENPSKDMEKCLRVVKYVRTVPVQSGAET